MSRSSLALAVAGCALSLPLGAGCSELRCGPGTHQVGGECVPIAADASVGPDAPPDATSMADTPRLCPASSPPPSTPGEVGCIGVVCSPPDTCVVSATTGEGRCLPPGSMELTWDGTLIRECDETADCSTGSVCCQTYVTSAVTVVTTVCEGSCLYGEFAQACRLDAECAMSGSCQSYELSPTLSVSTCRAPIGCE